ncbi:hypothetical protein FOA43_000063 [Brettanomyces nanus]|uniref:Uncharacterized protein n=1 Tax=Eeniella nana TaxID=13502 RepID=A0A875RXY9_EENNA|nr:uncharacterized protein FOA43_000063 [Brettanomyces nanus]QPG72762.1 hypothetical protein FOA43_000063 [Brettanomyces nanus]
MNLDSRNQMIDLSLQEIAGSGNENIWESCGKAFLRVNRNQYQNKLKDEKDGNVEVMSDLDKKKRYLETSINTTVDNMNRILDRLEKK